MVICPARVFVRTPPFALVMFHALSSLDGSAKLTEIV
jgi:hypothetical protein